MLVRGKTHAGAPGCHPSFRAPTLEMLVYSTRAVTTRGEEEPPTYSLAAYEENPLKPTGHLRPASRLSVLIIYLEADLIGCVLGFLEGEIFPPD